MKTLKLVLCLAGFLFLTTPTFSQENSNDNFQKEMMKSLENLTDSELSAIVQYASKLVAKDKTKDAIKDIVNQQLKEQLGKNKVRLTSGCLHEIEMTDFYPQDVLDGDFDYPISARINGLVLVFEPISEDEHVGGDTSSSESEGEEVVHSEEEEAAANNSRCGLFGLPGAWVSFSIPCILFHFCLQS